jgi:hypothetical protein
MGVLARHPACLAPAARLADGELEATQLALRELRALEGVVATRSPVPRCGMCD